MRIITNVKPRKYKKYINKKGNDEDWYTNYNGIPHLEGNTIMELFHFPDRLRNITVIASGRRIRVPVLTLRYEPIRCCAKDLRKQIMEKIRNGEFEEV